MEGPTIASGKVAKLDAEIAQLRALMKTGTLSTTAGQTALEILERDRAELLDTTRRRETKAGTNVVRILPQTAELYRAAVRDLQGTLKEPSERLQARALIFELLGGKVPLRPAASEKHSGAAPVECRGTASSSQWRENQRLPKWLRGQDFDLESVDTQGCRDEVAPV